MNNGYFFTNIKIKDNAVPIDNVTKFVWDDDDYEVVEEWHEYTEKELEWQNEHKEEEAKKEAQDKFLETAPDRLTATENYITALTSAFEGAEE